LRPLEFGVAPLAKKQTPLLYIRPPAAIVKRGFHPTKRRPFMNVLPFDKKLSVIAALVEGCSIRSTERMLDVNRNTIMSLLLTVGENCQRLLDERIRGLKVRNMEFDEIWTYVAKKQKRVKTDDPPEYGDQFVFVALDPDSKLIPSFRVGKRTPDTTWEFVNDVHQPIEGRFQLTTDGFRPYLRAVDDAFGADVDYAMLIKSFAAGSGEVGSYHPPTIAGIFHQAIFGNPDTARVCTSYVERQNLTIRMQLRRFTRLTNAYSKKLPHLKAALALHFAHYNFCRIHETLRCTPAMEAGVINEVWPLKTLLA
jgi:IS1 family transposase